jgi:hypothetical protein
LLKVFAFEKDFRIVAFIDAVASQYGRTPDIWLYAVSGGSDVILCRKREVDFYH